ncbi:hypothetical protein Nepgr_030076 [Nepenthes gracilis]|uniref:Uncharacterized protein n=1 Tax=Nepenthes gracilis TaxID=150966 RepID=A0AAD3TDU3_NEPGR|nr:hypothetical protein Nepgr_030076 [Nepenthes gracilis]
MWVYDVGCPFAAVAALVAVGSLECSCVCICLSRLSVNEFVAAFGCYPAAGGVKFWPFAAGCFLLLEPSAGGLWLCCCWLYLLLMSFAGAGVASVMQQHIVRLLEFLGCRLAVGSLFCCGQHFVRLDPDGVCCVANGSVYGPLANWRLQLLSVIGLGVAGVWLTLLDHAADVWVADLSWDEQAGPADAVLDEVWDLLAFVMLAGAYCPNPLDDAGLLSFGGSVCYCAQLLAGNQMLLHLSLLMQMCLPFVLHSDATLLPAVLRLQGTFCSWHLLGVGLFCGFAVDSSLADAAMCCCIRICCKCRIGIFADVVELSSFCALSSRFGRKGSLPVSFSLANRLALDQMLDCVILVLLLSVPVNTAVYRADLFWLVVGAGAVHVGGCV